MGKFVSVGFTSSIILYTALFFISSFFSLESTFSLLAILGILIVVFAGFILPIKQFALQLFLLVSAILVLAFTSDGFVVDIKNGFLQMKSLISLLAIVPMISWVLREEPYIDEIMSFAHSLLNTSRKFYFGLMAITQVITYFLLFGAIPMMYHFINSFLKDHTGEAWENFKGTSLLRGFALSTLWVISIPSFVFAVEALHASLFIAIIQGFLISFCGILLAVCFSYFQEKSYRINLSDALRLEIDRAMERSKYKGWWNPKVLEFSILFFSLFGTIFFVHGFWKIDLLLIIPVVIFLWASLYYLVKRRPIKLVIELRSYIKTGLVKQSQQFSILLAAGLFIYSLNQSGFGRYLVDFIYYITEVIPILNFLFLLPFVVVILGFLGLGPLTVIVLVAGILEGVTLPYPPELIVLSITSGSVISILLSPFIMPVIVLSNVNQLSGLKNGFQFNWKYAITFYCVVQLYIQTMVHFWS